MLAWGPCTVSIYSLLAFITVALVCSAAVSDENVCSREPIDLGVSSPHHLKIYIVPLPRKYTHDLYDEYHDFAFYSSMTWDAPFGARHHEGHGSIWSTNQYSLLYWFYKQLSISPLRVFNASEADVLFVPLFTTFMVSVHFRWVVRGGVGHIHK